MADTKRVVKTYSVDVEAGFYPLGDKVAKLICDEVENGLRRDKRVNVAATVPTQINIQTGEIERVAVVFWEY